MGRNVRKNSFVEGAVIAYVAIVFTKLLGALYNIPFYNIIGERGGVIYSYAYSIYALFLDISTSGIPVAISIVISEYNSRGMYRSKERAYSLGLKVVAAISLTAIVLLQLFANQIGQYFISDMREGVAVGDVAQAIRSIAVCLLVVPFLSMRRGYFQGHKCVAVSSASQVIEQVVRIAVVLVGAYLAIRVWNLGTTTGVCVALLGAAAGALAALAYLNRKRRQNSALFFDGAECEEAAPAPAREILRKIFSYCVTIIIVSAATNIYSLVDMKMLLEGLNHLGYSDEATQVIASISSSWIPKICMIVVALSMGLTSSIAPHMAESYAAGNLRDVNFKLNQALGTLLAVSVPLAAGMITLSEPIYRLFYGASPYGGSILRLSLVVNVVASMATVVSMAMQSMNRGKSVCVFTVIGILVNTALDLPLIFLFQALGLPAYLGAPTASIIGQFLTLTLLLGSLRRRLGFGYLPALHTLLRALPPAAAAIGLVYLLRAVWPVADGRGPMLILQLGVFALTGGGVYFTLAYFTGALREIVSGQTLRRVLEKFKPKKKNRES